MPRKRTHVEEFDPRRVKPFAGQPRKRFRDIQELADSIAEVGQLAPGIVTLIDGDPDFDAELVDGERRLRACRIAGKDFRAEIRANTNADDLFAASFAANFGKQDHDVMEIAEALARLQKAGKSLEQMGKIAGRTGTWAAQHLNLLKLSPECRAMMTEDADKNGGGKLTFAIAQLLVPIEDYATQTRLAKRIVNGGLSIAAARRLVLKHRFDAGDTTAYANKLGQQRTLTTIESICEAAANRIGVYLDMPRSSLNELIDSADVPTQTSIIEHLEDASEKLLDLAEEIQSRMPRQKKRSA